MNERIRITTDDELNEWFEGIMIPVTDPFIGEYQVPGWKCKRCGWAVGARLYPPSHVCPDDGSAQATARAERERRP